MTIYKRNFIIFIIFIIQNVNRLFNEKSLASRLNEKRTSCMGEIAGRKG